MAGIFGVGRRPTQSSTVSRSHERRSREKKRFCFQPAFRAGHYKDLTETRNRAREVSGTYGNVKDGLEMKNDANSSFLAM